jgi:hypothetical protein
MGIWWGTNVDDESICMMNQFQDQWETAAVIYLVSHQYLTQCVATWISNICASFTNVQGGQMGECLL